MSKDEFVGFPWNPTKEVTTSKLEGEIKNPTESRISIFIKKYQVHITITIMITGLLFALNQNQDIKTQKAKPLSESTLSVLVPVVSIPKGYKLEPHLLKPVIAPAKAFSKTQLLSVFTEDDIERLNGHLIAKKDLAPYRPFFWSSVELKTFKIQEKLKIRYSNGTPKEVSP